MAGVARRACLVVAADDERRRRKALELPGDEVVLDLEDAVPAERKAAARDGLAAILADPLLAGRTVAVRVNGTATAWFAEDVRAVGRAAASIVSTAVAGCHLTVIVPKVEAPDDLAATRALLGDAGAPGLGLQALIETPAGLLHAHEIALAEDGLEGLVLGYADLAAALGRRGAQDDPATWLACQEILLSAARHAGIQAIDGPSMHIDALHRTAREARRARDLGFDGKWAIHPAQLKPLLELFTPSADELDDARRTIEALDGASDEGRGATAHRGGMVDEAHRRHAERILALQTGARRAPAAEPAADSLTVAAPFYEDLRVGQRFDAPGVTLTEGHAALHQAIVGDRLRLALDQPLCEAVTGAPGALVHPLLVCDVAIGQSTSPSGRVLGNLFYRGLVVRPVRIGTTLRTTTEVVALRRASRGPRGLVVLDVRTVDEHGTPVLGFQRCPLLPARSAADGPGDPAASANDFASGTGDVDLTAGTAALPRDWDLGAYRDACAGDHFDDLRAGVTFVVEARETITCAPELARLSLNLATTHTDAHAGHHDQRLVYGGHVLGIACGHLLRCLPNVLWVPAWRSCEHLGPAFEGDRIATTVHVESLHRLDSGGLADVRVRCTAERDGVPRDVLDWRLLAWLA
jgi:citrate lyase beta subunit/acyl dehydratase